MPIRKEVFIKNYIKALNNGDAAVFAGAGLSASSGCVNWKQLLGEIAEELQLDIEKESDLVAIAQYYYNKNGSNRTRLNDIIKDAFQTGKNPNVNHNILARLPVSTYWTTNYDKLIEKSLENNGKICDVKTCCANLTTTLKGRNVVVYKMHGDVDHPEEAVLIRDDYESYSQEKRPFINALSGDLMTKTFLFIGFSFTDPNFSYICAHLRTHLKGNMREHYCFLKDISRDDYEDESEFEYEKRKLSYFIDDLKRFNIKTILSIRLYKVLFDAFDSVCGLSCNQKERVLFEVYIFGQFVVGKYKIRQFRLAANHDQLIGGRFSPVPKRIQRIIGAGQSCSLSLRIIIWGISLCLIHLHGRTTRRGKQSHCDKTNDLFHSFGFSV